MEMINGHALVISLMATALIASRVSRFFAPPLYESLAERYRAPLPQPAPAPVPEVPEVEVPGPVAEEIAGDASANDDAGAPRQ